MGEEPGRHRPQEEEQQGGSVLQGNFWTLSRSRLFRKKQRPSAGFRQNGPCSPTECAATGKRADFITMETALGSPAEEPWIATSKPYRAGSSTRTVGCASVRTISAGAMDPRGFTASSRRPISP